MAAPIPPLFILSLTDPRDAWIFGNERELGGFIEPPDFEEHAHVVFDSTGRKAKVAVKDYSVVVIGWSETTDEEEFERLVRRSLEAYGSPPAKSREDMVNGLAAVLREEQWRHDRLGRLFAWLFRRRTKQTGRV